MKTIIDFILKLLFTKKNNWVNDQHLNNVHEETLQLKYVSPVKDRYVTSPFGYRNLEGVKQWHSGVDYAGTTNKDAAAPCTCTLTHKLDYDLAFPCQFEWSQKSGWVRINNIPAGRGWTPYVVLKAANGIRFIYRHGTTAKEVGDTIQAGEYFYKIDTYGNSQGAHLHWEVEVEGKNVDPEKWLNENI